MVTAGPVYQTDDPSPSMNRRGLTLMCLLMLSASLPGWAQSALRGPNWTEREALRAAAEVDLLTELKPLFGRARAGEDRALRRQLEDIAANEEWPLPARERLLHAFALGIGELPAGSVGPEVLSYLRQYRPGTLVPHDDTDLAGVPLFDVPAAAAGSLNQWQRQIGYQSSGEVLARGGAAWIAAWLEAGPARRRGLADALDLASGGQLKELAVLALHDLPAQPELTLVAARAAALLPDPDLLGDALVAGGGPELAAALRSAGTSLDEAERADLLRRLVAEAPAATGSLAIAALTPGLLHDPAVAGLLFDLLSHPALGAAAALSLARSRQPAVREQLATLAARDDDTPARRAANAISAVRRADAGSRP